MKRFTAVMLARFVFVSILSLSSLLIAGTYSGGSGEPNNPYQISSAADLVQLSATSDDWDKHFTLTADINLAGINFTRTLIAPDTDKTTAKFQGVQFSGTFDGGNHTISNLTIIDNNDIRNRPCRKSCFGGR